MADEDDSFIREVNEELRRENARALWGRYGSVLIGGAVALVLGTAVWQGYAYWLNSKSVYIGNKMVNALRLGFEKQYDLAFAGLDEVKESDFGAYSSLAALRQAALLQQQGNRPAAVDAFDAIAADKTTPEILKKIAVIRAAYLLVDIGTFADVEQRVKILATDDDAPMRAVAREIMGLAAWKAQNWDEARGYFERIVQDRETNISLGGFQARARQMLELLKEHGSDAGNTDAEG